MPGDATAKHNAFSAAIDKRFTPPLKKAKNVRMLRSARRHTCVRSRARGLVLTLGLCSFWACGGGLGPIKPPDAPHFIDDTDPERARVTMTKNPSAPLVVDWQPEYRADLEVTTKRGLAVVHFDRKTFELLPDCHAEGSYSYVGVTPKEQHITLRSRAELQANLPLGAFKLEGRLGHEGALMVALRMVGKQILDRPAVSRDQLSGNCAGATHYVSALTIGAFKFAAAAHASAAAEASVFGNGASGDASGDTETLQTDGDFAACDQADPDAAKAPSRCRAVIRIQIVPLDGAVTADSEQPKCGDGMKWNGQMCVTERRIQVEAQQAEQTSKPVDAPSAKAPKGYQCEKSDAQECLAQCKAGNMPSCNILGYYLQTGQGGMPKDAKRAVELWGVGCKSGYGEACTSLALYLEDKRLFREAAEIGTKGCSAGDPHACTEVAVLAFFGRGVPQNRPAAFKLWLRGCKLRDWNACNNAGVMILHGIDGAPKNPAAARKLFTAACASPGKEGCGNLADCYELGLGGPKDFAMAVKLGLEACSAGGASSCASTGLLIEENGDKPEYKKKALELYEKGCAMPAGGGCFTEKEMRQYFPGLYSDEGYDRRSCEDGDQRALACYNAAIASERGYGGSVDLAKAKQYLDIACQKGGMKKACRAPHAR